MNIKKITHTLTAIDFEKRKEILWVSLCVIGACMCFYIYAITATVRNIVLERNTVAEAGNVSEKVSTEEFQLINLENQITMNSAQALGYQEPTQKVFISPASVSFVSSNANQI